MYNKVVMDHFKNPRNLGEIENPDAEATIGNPSCGDVMKIMLKVEGDKIKDIKFQTFGCAAAIASSSHVAYGSLSKYMFIVSASAEYVITK